MVIIGFDPGLTNTGYAVLRKKNNEITMVECGLISPKKGKEVSERLYTIFFETNNLIKKFKPEVLYVCLLYTSPSPRDRISSRMPSSA